MAPTLMVVLAPAAGDWVPPAAFAGALGGVGLSWLLGRSAGGTGTPTLLLAGVAVGSLLSAAQAFARQLNTETIRQVYTWMLGAG
jgi:cobalamin transport system permease protein